MSIKPLRGAVRLNVMKIKEQNMRNMHEWSFSASAEWVVGVLLAVTIVATLFV